MTFGTGRGRLYDAQKTARARLDAVREVWQDDASRRFDERVWQPLDRLVGDTLRAADQLAVALAQARQECAFTPEF